MGYKFETNCLRAFSLLFFFFFFLKTREQKIGEKICLKILKNFQQKNQNLLLKKIKKF